MDNNENIFVIRFSEHHFHIICVATLECQLCTGRDHSSSVHAELYKRDKEINNDRDLHLPGHTHNAGCLLHVTRNVNVPSVYNPGVFSNDE